MPDRKLHITKVHMANSSPGNLWFDLKQIATVLILPQCKSMVYLKLDTKSPKEC